MHAAYVQHTCSIHPAHMHHTVHHSRLIAHMATLDSNEHGVALLRHIKQLLSLDPCCRHDWVRRVVRDYLKGTNTTATTLLEG